MFTLYICHNFLSITFSNIFTILIKLKVNLNKKIPPEYFNNPGESNYLAVIKISK